MLARTSSSWKQLSDVKTCIPPGLQVLLSTVPDSDVKTCMSSRTQTRFSGIPFQRQGFESR